MAQNNSRELTACETRIKETETYFTGIVEENNLKLNFKKEASFALQVLQNNNFTLSTAMRDPLSLQNAIKNVASIGLTLNPAEKLAYLVPRDGKICLDISYMGLTTLATETGSINYCVSKLVYKSDTYENNGPDREPTHNYSPFGDRGPIVGAYCVVKTLHGDYLTEEMSLDELYAIRNRSIAWKKSKSGPWATDEGEMMRKTVTKRAAKRWPRVTDAFDRVGKAIEVLNEGGEGIDFESERVQTQAAQVTNVVTENFKLKSEIIEEIKKLSAFLCEGLTLEQKSDFVETKLDVDKFANLIKKSEDDLKDIHLHLIELKEARNGNEG